MRQWFYSSFPANHLANNLVWNYNFNFLLQNQPVEGEDASDVKFRHITEITILTVQLIVEFAKRLPGFDKLLREDQIALLKVLHFYLST